MTPPERFFLIATDFSAGRIKPQQLEAFLRGSRFVSEVISPIPLIYIVRSALDSSGLSNMLLPLMDQSPFVVTVIDPQMTDGWLQRRVWDWFEAGKNLTSQGAVQRLLRRDQ